MEAFIQYREKVQELLAQIEETQLERAAELLAETIKNNKLIYVLGTGAHAYMAAEEMFWRAGGLVPIKPILPAGFALAHGATRTTLLERTENYIKAVLDYEGLEQGDVLILVNSYGINPATIEAALKGKKMGARIIALTSTTFCQTIPADHPARHGSGKNLCDLDEVEVLIDNKMPAEDAIVSFEGMDVKVSPVSTILNMFVLEALVACTAELLLAEKIEPPVWKSVNLPGGDDYNKKYLAQYRERIKSL